jgi:hypothetical protein
MSNNYYFDDNGTVSVLTEPLANDTAVTVTSAVTFQNKTIEGGTLGNVVAIDRIATGGSPVLIDSTPPTPGQALITTSATGASWSSILSLTFFGTGADPDPNIGSGATVTLTQDMYYADLTIAAGGTLLPNGYRVFVKGIATIDGVISNNGLPASGTSGAPALPAGTLGGAGAGATGAGASGFIALATGGASGFGGNGSAESGQPGGIVTPPSASVGGYRVWSDVFSALKGVVLNGSKCGGGVGGGGGGSNGTGGISGGGGGGGGIILLSANIVTGTGTISATGGTGGDAPSVDCGGGGGGGGGVLAMITNVNNFTGTIDLSGGAGGLGGGGAGQAGNPGSIGQTFIITR